MTSVCEERIFGARRMNFFTSMVAFRGRSTHREKGDALTNFGQTLLDYTLCGESLVTLPPHLIHELGVRPRSEIQCVSLDENEEVTERGLNCDGVVFMAWLITNFSI